MEPGSPVAELHLSDLLVGNALAARVGREVHLGQIRDRRREERARGPPDPSLSGADPSDPGEADATREGDAPASSVPRRFPHPPPPLSPRPLEYRSRREVAEGKDELKRECRALRVAYGGSKELEAQKNTSQHIPDCAVGLGRGARRMERMNVPGG